ncbi:MAG: hypothetical protein M8840_08970 [marine benthic group bacterium]|jgi:hypothetical protein|nr:hypothetical protein [Gemmatimonadota bacterium]
MRKGLLVLVVSLLLPVSAGSLHAQASSEATPDLQNSILVPREMPESADWGIADALPLTCLQLWQAYGENNQDVIDIVTTMAGMSVINRELEFPQTEEAGRMLGEGILKGCTQDRNDLMYAIVDRNVRKVVAEHANR